MKVLRFGVIIIIAGSFSGKGVSISLSLETQYKPTAAAGSLPDTSSLETALKEIRLGHHGNVVRVVFEFTDVIQYQVVENHDAAKIALQFFNASSQTADEMPKDNSGCVATITTTQEGAHLSAGIQLSSPGFRLNSFKLQTPVRVVMDVSCEGEAAMPGSLHATETIVEASEPMTTTNNPADQQVIRPSAATPDKGAPAPHKTRKDIVQKYMIALLAVITLAIILFIGLIIYHRKAVSGSLTANKTTAKGNTGDTMAAIDTKIREEFKKYNGE